MRIHFALLPVVLAIACSKQPAPKLQIESSEVCGRIGWPGDFGGIPPCMSLGDEKRLVGFAFDGTDLVVGNDNLHDSTIVVADKQGEARGAEGTIIFRVPLGDAAQAWSVESFENGTVDLMLDGKAARARTEFASFSVPPVHIRRPVLRRFAEVTKGPVKLAAPSTAPAQHTIALVVRQGDWEQVVFGPAKTLGEIDYVAVGAPQPERKLRDCDYETQTCYGGSCSRGFTKIPMMATDERITIYNRLTGAVVESRDFAAGEVECPSSISGSKDKIEAAVEYKDVRTWLRGRVATTNPEQSQLVAN